MLDECHATSEDLSARSLQLGPHTAFCPALSMVKAPMYVGTKISLTKGIL